MLYMLHVYKLYRLKIKAFFWMSASVSSFYKILHDYLAGQRTELHLLTRGNIYKVHRPYNNAMLVCCTYPLLWNILQRQSQPYLLQHFKSAVCSSFKIQTMFVFLEN
jgi:hypothetical protein